MGAMFYLLQKRFMGNATQTAPSSLPIVQITCRFRTCYAAEKFEMRLRREKLSINAAGESRTEAVKTNMRHDFRIRRRIRKVSLPGCFGDYPGELCGILILKRRNFPAPGKTSDLSRSQFQSFNRFASTRFAVLTQDRRCVQIV